MAHIFHMEEWYSGYNNKWYCGDVSALEKNSNTWWYPCTLLDITPVEFVKLLIDKYNVTDIHYEFKYDVLIYRFSSLADCRRFKNYINKQAREKNFVIY